MRASKTVKREALSVKGKKPQLNEIHISGAEGLYGLSQIEQVTKDYFLRAMNHPKGRPDKVVITVEKVKENPVVVSLLPVVTLKCGSPDHARGIIRRLLSGAGVSTDAIRKGLRVVTGKAVMHGAAIMRSESALRVEPEKKRGIRVSRFGIQKAAEVRLSRRLSGKGIDTVTVKEAIVLASKVASCKGVVAELCVSDDPDYTTGYISSKGLGYIRIPNIKEKGRLSGGRVFFVDEKADVRKIVEYLERTPVLVGK